MNRVVQWIGLAGVVWGALIPCVAMTQDVATHDDQRRESPEVEELLNRKVTLDLRNVSLDRAIQLVAAKANTTILSNYTVLARYPTAVTLHVNDETLRSTFERLFAGTSLQIVTLPNARLVVVDGVRRTDGKAVGDSTGMLAGVVVDSATGKPVERAMVKIMGTTLTAVTSVTGQFAMHAVPLGDRQLSVRLFGYRPALRDVTVTSEKLVTLRVLLTTTATVLSGVVTTATGMQERVRVGNDIAVLNVDSLRNIAPITSVTDLLATRVPGLTVVRSSGVPGAPSRIRLRGASSVATSNDPIVIVDGVRVYAQQSGAALTSGASSATTTVSGGSQLASGNVNQPPYTGPSPIDQIDPNSIETIEVFKGPSAAAMYGSDAANGVIVITTRRGRAGPTRWNVALNQGVNTQPSGSWPLKYYRFGQVLDGSGGSVQCSRPVTNSDPQCLSDSVVAFQALNDPRFSPLKTGTTQDVSLSVSGGNAALAFSVTGSAGNANGYMRLPDIEATRFRVAHGFEAPDWMKNPDTYSTWGGTSRLDWRLGDRGGAFALTNSLFSSAQQQSSLSAGSALVQLGGSYIDLVALGNRPLLDQYYNRAQLNSSTSTNALTFTWPLASWLSALQVMAGLSQSSTDNNAVTPRNYKIGLSGDSVGTYDINRTTTRTPTFSASTAVRLPHVTTTVGLNVNAVSRTEFSAATRGLPIGVLQTNIFNYVNGGPTQASLSQSTYGWYVQPTLDLKSRLFISPGVRFDGGSASGSEAGLSLLPKIDLSYLAIDRREGNAWLGAITLLRPRIAYGVAGVQPQPADKLRLLSQSVTVPPGGVTTTTTSLSYFGNTELKPERSRELEGGVDAELWNQRLTFNLTVYRKVRYDAILPFQLAPSVGYALFGQTYAGSIEKNIGTVRNTGVNASVGVMVADSRALRWNVNANVTSNQNVVVQLAPGVEGTWLGGDSYLKAGYPLFALFAKPIAGYADANHDGIIQYNEVRLADSMAYLGQGSEPKYQLALSTSVAFFNSRLSINTEATYQNGLTQYNASSLSAAQIGGGFSPSPLLAELNDSATSLAQQAAIAVLYPPPLDAAATSTLVLYQTVNTLRWSSLSVNVIMPVRVAHVFRASSMMVALQGSNLGLHTNYRGKDPDVNANATGNTTSDIGQLPQPRAFALRVTLGN